MEMHSSSWELFNSGSNSRRKYLLLLATTMRKIIQHSRRALRFLFSDDISSYENLLAKSRNGHVYSYRARALCIEIFKIVHANNPKFMQDIFIVWNSNRPSRNSIFCDLLSLRYGTSYKSFTSAQNLNVSIGLIRK